MRSIRKSLALLLVVLLVAALPAKATSLEDLILALEVQYASIPDLSCAFGTEGIAQGEVFASDIITGNGTLYEDSGSGYDAADLVLLQQGFSAVDLMVAAHEAILYEKDCLRVLILPQVVSGRTLVITSSTQDTSASVSSLTPSPTPSSTPSLPAGENAWMADICIGGECISLPLTETLLSDIYTEASFSDGIRQLILGLPTASSAGDVISPEYVLTQSECYPYITYIDENGMEWYALAWNEPITVMDDLSIAYNVKMEPGDLADYSIAFTLVTSVLWEGSFTSSLACTDSPENVMDLSGSFRFGDMQP